MCSEGSPPASMVITSIAVDRVVLRIVLAWKNARPNDARRNLSHFSAYSLSDYDTHRVLNDVASARRLGGEALGLVDRLLDGADHVEGGLRQMIVLAVAQALEAADRVGQLDEHALRAGEHFGDM